MYPFYTISLKYLLSILTNIDMVQPKTTHDTFVVEPVEFISYSLQRRRTQRGTKDGWG
jgi:hypothetical protein